MASMQQLRECCLTSSQGRFMKAVLGLDDQTAIPVGKLSDTDAQRMVHKIKQAGRLSKMEFVLLCHLDQFYKDLDGRFPQGRLDQVEAAVNIFLQSRSQAVKSVEKKQKGRPWPKTGTSPFSLTLFQAQAADALLGLNGESVEGGISAVIKKLYPDATNPKKIKNIWRFKIQRLLPHIFNKIREWWQSSAELVEATLQQDPWYGKLARTFPVRTAETLELIRQQIFRKVDVDLQYYQRSNKQAEKKVFQQIAQTPPWQTLGERDRQIISRYYGFDLAGDETRRGQDLVAEFGLTKRFILNRIEEAKLRLKRLDPDLPLLVTRTALLRVRPVRPPKPAPVCRPERPSQPVLVSKAEQMPTKGMTTSEAKAHSKKIFLQIQQTPLWEELDSKDQQLAVYYYGLDLSEYETRNTLDTAREFDLPHAQAVWNRLEKIKIFLKQKDPALAFGVTVKPTVSRRILQNPHLKPEHKKVFLRLAQTVLWQKLTEYEQKMVSLYYGLDLPGDEIRKGDIVASQLGLERASLNTRLQKIKAMLKQADPSLPFASYPGLNIPRRFETVSSREIWRLLLSPFQAQLASAFLETRAEAGSYEVMKQAFPEDSDEEISRRWSYQVEQSRARIFRKLRLFWEVPEEVCRAVVATDSWYQKLVQIFPERTPEVLERVRQLVFRTNDMPGSHKTYETTADQMQYKQVFLRLAATPLWETLLERDRDILAYRFGFDLPGLQSRTLRETAQRFSISWQRTWQIVERAKACLKQQDASLPFKISEHQPQRAERSIQSRSGIFVSKSQTKEIFLRVMQTPLWDRLWESDQRIIIFYFGLDLPGHQTRSISETADLLSRKAQNVASRIQSVKRHLKQWDSSLPFRVSLYKPKLSAFGEVPPIRSTLVYIARQYYNFPEANDDLIKEQVAAMGAGDERARYELFKMGLRYVLPVAYGWTVERVRRDAGFEVEDLIQEGSIGFWRELPRFSGATRAEFREFACEAAKRGIKISLRRAGLSIQLEQELARLTRKIDRAIRQFLEKLGREPEIPEIAELLKLPAPEIERGLAAMRLSLRPSFSLDSPIKRDGDDGDSWYALVPDPQTLPESKRAATAQEMMDSWYAESAEKSIQGRLSVMEQHVVALRFGFLGEPMELTAIAELTGSSENAVAVILEDALQKLRSSPEVIEKMERYLERPKVSKFPFRIGVGSGSTKPVVPDRLAARSDSLETRREATAKQAGRVASDGQRGIPLEAEAAVPSVAEESFAIHAHRWETALASTDSLLEELADEPRLESWIKEGLIPARSWYRGRGFSPR